MRGLFFYFELGEYGFPAFGMAFVGVEGLEARVEVGFDGR